MELYFKTIPHNEERYDTCGDYWEDENGVMNFRVSEMDNQDYEFAVLLHELIEWHLFRKTGKPIKLIDDFDIAFEELRKRFPDLIGKQEPGCMVSAPYNEQHEFAEQIERIFIGKLGIKWEDYNDAVESL